MALYKLLSNQRKQSDRSMKTRFCYDYSVVVSPYNLNYFIFFAYTDKTSFNLSYLVYQAKRPNVGSSLSNVEIGLFSV